MPEYYKPKDEIEKQSFLAEARSKLTDLKIAILETEKKIEPLSRILNILQTIKSNIEDYIKFLETGEL